MSCFGTQSGEPTDVLADLNALPPTHHPFCETARPEETPNSAFGSCNNDGKCRKLCACDHDTTDSCNKALIFGGREAIEVAAYLSTSSIAWVAS